MILDLFKIPLYSVNLNLDTQKISEYCLLHQIDNDGRQVSNAGGYQSKDLVGEHPQLNDLFIQIEEHGKSFAGDLHLGKVLLDNIWININDYKDHNLPHVHSDCALSGVYYTNVPINGGEIAFKHPSAYIKHEWKNPHINTSYTSSNIGMPVHENCLYIFPSWLEHLVMPNMSMDKRISISFNLKLDKRVILW